MTSHSMKNLAFIASSDDHTTDSRYITYTFSFKRLGECTFWTLEWKGKLVCLALSVIILTEWRGLYWAVSWPAVKSQQEDWEKWKKGCGHAPAIWTCHICANRHFEAGFWDEDHNTKLPWGIDRDLEVDERCVKRAMTNIRIVTDNTSAVALTQIAAYSTHKNQLAVRKIMEAMRTASAKSGIQSQHVSNYTWRKCEQHFSNSLNLLMVVKVLLKSAIRFSHSFHWHAFPNFCRQISRPLGY